MANWLTFLGAYIKDPKNIGAITPTSRYVARRVIRQIPATARTIVEYGPGNGAVTLPVLKGMPRSAKLIAIERNPAFVETLKKVRSAKLQVVHGNAQDAAKYAKKPDVILSALPFNSFPESLKHEILANTAKNMRKDSKFVVYLQYSRVLEDYLPQYFSAIEHEYEPRNLPPSHLYICSGPR
ncbi:MAG TPA: rRNA adenine N-6-methyltransferase family protein [Candidatus Binatia bacterium]|nr:rRNA adenine N-6-methyltransferase family protein [Candidatus Binatia bacterium]